MRQDRDKLTFHLTCRSASKDIQKLGPVISNLVPPKILNMSLESDPWEMLEYMMKLRVVVFIEYASVAILIFDYFLTLGPEIQFVWKKSPWNLGRVLFFLTRYTPFIGGFLTLYVDVIRDAGLSKCAKLTQAAVYFAVVDIIIAEVILTLRVSALWSGNRKVIFLLVLAVVATSSVSISQIAQVHVAQNTFGEDMNRVYGVCPPYFASSNAMTVCYMILVSYETLIFTLTVIKAVEHYRQPGRSSFIDIFFADGLSYNVFILACSVANIIVRYKTTSEYINLFTSLQPVIHSVLTSRMMLHLKQSAIRKVPSTWGNIHFDGHQEALEEVEADEHRSEASLEINARLWFAGGQQRRN
ncbi:hypothetical protein Moror_3579 [Moniliophthora roreri MCA 2997]|uniref:DUF6533 domain-containing protein n=1 Tax=Moniliophthora roreri (strain MCA 2997) TaxID=1381753 RepID=V2WUA8_MONRO|nr:hypothetical protein Moror_3579 [Moniliophthora roreri MCA 2997]